MAEFFGSLPLFSIVLTLCAFQIGQWCQKKWRSPLCNPIVIAVLLIVIFLLLTGLPNESYQAGAGIFSWLLTPATVCLALPLHRQVKILKKNMTAILAGVIAGAVSSLVCVLGMAMLFGLDRSMTVSLLPKSITTAMGIVLSDLSGGIQPLTAAAIVITGILGSLLSPLLFRVFRLEDPISQGVALGTASHVIGTSRANELGELQGAVSSLSLAVAGIVTAVLFPLVTLLL